MADQWKARVTTIAGKPVALVDVTIQRTIFIDAQAFEKIAQILKNSSGDFGPSGLSGVGEFYETIQTVPERARPFVVVPWTKADSDTIGLRPFAEILHLLEDNSYWRLDGNAETGFRGYLNFGGQDRVIDISEATAPAIQVELERIREGARADEANGKLTQADSEKIKRVCDIVGWDTIECVRFIKEMKQVREENDRIKREQQEKALRDDVRDRTSRSEHESGVSRGLGDRFSGFAQP